MDLISVHYDEIRSLFRSRTYNMGMSFNEDLFGDAFIKCYQKFGDEHIDYDTAIKYFWVTYMNTVKSTFIIGSKYEIVSIDDIEDIAIDEAYQHRLDMCNEVLDAIESEYGTHDMMLYNLYKYYEWSESDLESAGYDCKGLKNKVKDIHKFAKTYVKKNKKSL